MNARPLLILLLLGCAPAYLDLDGRPIPAPQLVGSTERGTVVVDSAGGSLRVIVEFQAEVKNPEPEVASLPSLALRVDRSLPVAPRRVVRDRPACNRVPTGGNVGPVGPDRTTAPSLVDTVPQTCTVLLRAEFSAPTGLFDERVALLVGDAVYVVRWRRRGR